MNQVAGITIERNTRGRARYARIDLNKYGERLMPFLREVGVTVDKSPNDEKDAFIYTSKVNASKIFSKYL
ncbi:MAG: hypothetical protein LBN93_00995 [Candidatus Symbiothrix sp.]|jgi:hypothetical protein|nr:hypothetical protein [Candidatus Symbiothrix sp.]